MVLRTPRRILEKSAESDSVNLIPDLLRAEHTRESSEQRWENCKRLVYICGNDLCNSQRQSAVGTSVLVRNIASYPEDVLNYTLDTPRSNHSHHQSRWFHSPDDRFPLFLFFFFFSWLSTFSLEKENAKWRNKKLKF